MKHTTTFITAIVSLFLCLHIAGQSTTGTVTGAVKTPEGKAAVAATVSLYRAKDSSLIKSAISNKLGQFEISNIREGNYFLSVSLAGHKKFNTTLFTVNPGNTVHSFNSISLQVNEGVLKEVVVEAKKPFIENQVDKIVVNVEGSIVSAGSSALEVLERSPGIVVDNNDNISMSGRQGLIVMIDNRPTPMSGADLATMLRGIPSSMIEKIELISNPSAKYDAAGTAGMINIKMKKDQRLGTNGNYTLSYGQGIYPKANGGVSVNHRDKKINLFGNYNYNYSDNFSHLTLYRRFLNDTKEFDGAYDADNFVSNLQQSHTYRAGLDYSPSKKTIIGAVLTGFNNQVERDGDNFSEVIDKFNQPASTFSTLNKSRGKWDNLAANLNYKTIFDSAGRELSIDADYASYINSNKQNISTVYKDISGSQIQDPYLLFGNTDGKLTIKALKTDYVSPLKKGARLEAGFKSSFVRADNELRFYDRSNGGNVLDSGKSNHFIYDENINAGYLSLRKPFKKLTIQVGLRAEQTNVKGVQLFNGRSFDSSYFQLFPSVFIQKPLSEKHIIGLSVNRRIDRPSYSQLNPFVFFIDPSTYQSGNPYLRPQSTYNIALSHTFKQKYITSFTYARTTNVMSTVIMPDETQDKVTVNTDVNLTSLDFFSLSIAAPIQVTKWWNSINNFNGFYGHYKGNLAGTSLSNGIPAFTINSNNSFTFKKGWSAELTGFFMSKHRMGFLTVKPFGQIGAGVQKTVFNRKGTLRFNITDIFYTGFIRANSVYEKFDETFRVPRDTRVARLTFSYRFGKNTVAASRRRGTGADEEKQRVNTGGN